MFFPLKIVHVKNDTESYRKPLEAGDKTGDPQTQAGALIRRKHPEISNENECLRSLRRKFTLIQNKNKNKQTNKKSKTKTNGKFIVKQEEIAVFHKVYNLGAK